MFKTLLKKQMRELFATWFVDRKTGKGRSKGGFIGSLLLYVFLLLMLCGIFYNSASTLCAPLAQIGMSSLYFTIMSLIALALGVFGSVFNTFSALYKAKDNEFLLSMPIPPGKLLLSRMTSTWVMGVIYETVVMLPALIVYYINVEQTKFSIAFSILIAIEISFIILVLSCALGWVVALISNKLKNKSIITVILSLAFLAGYYVVYFRAYEYIGMIVQNVDTVSTSLKAYVFLFYQAGIAATGEVVPMLMVTAVTVVVFSLVLFVMSRTFIKMTTSERAASKIIYKEKNTSRKSEDAALLKKEFTKFLSSPNYMLNCALGTVMMPALGIFSLIKGQSLLSTVNANISGFENILPLVAAAAVCMLSSMNDITAPSISLEGKSLWIIRSYPVDMKKVLLAKLKLHLIMTVIPGIFACICICISLKITLVESVIICLISIAFIFFNGSLGLLLNLKKPNFSWTNEVAPIKQSAGVVITIFGSWGVIIVFALIYLLINSIVLPAVYLAVCLAFVIAAAAALMTWVFKKGYKILESF